MDCVGASVIWPVKWKVPRLLNVTTSSNRDGEKERDGGLTDSEDEVHMGSLGLK